MQRRTFDILRWTLLVVGGLLLPVLYHCIWMPVSPEGLDKALFERGIATPVLLWLNGYLGSFFNLRYLGDLGWLVVPMLAWGVWNMKRLAPWQRGFVILILLAAMVIGGMGGFNYRYALTLLPVLTVGSMLVLWSAFDHFGHSRRERMVFLAAVVVVSACNTALAFNHRARVRSDVPQPAVVNQGPRTLRDRLDPSPEDLNGWLARTGFAAGDTILVNNLPEFYYTTSRPGVYFWCGTDQVFLSDGPHFLFRGRSDDQAATYLRDSLHCSGILSTRDLSAFEPRFASFLSTHCTLVGEEARGYTVHRITKPNVTLP